MDIIRREIKQLLVQFEGELGYPGVKGNDYHVVLDGMHQQATRIDVPYPEGSASWHAFNLGTNYALLCYPKLPLEVRVYTGILTWLGVIIDDAAAKDPEEWYQFIPRFHAAAGHPDNGLAQEFDRWLRLTYRYYSLTVANFIVSSWLDFVNTSALEGSDVPRVTRTAGGQNWPYYLRMKNSIAEGYAWMTFPKEICPDVPCYIEAVADMSKYIAFVNDVFSFYKEECACETDNYMHTRTFYEDVGVLGVLKKVIKESLDAHRRISLVLEGKEPYMGLWLDHALGYVGMHTTSERYRLLDLGLSESLPKS
ncbi:isoprenoid synthase domain-containing protein [Xylaria sp. FL1777]|nr:isoprenoid synthase domain-containing protein [Xylaria sp. FL1777]